MSFCQTFTNFIVRNSEGKTCCILFSNRDIVFSYSNLTSFNFAKFSKIRVDTLWKFERAKGRRKHPPFRWKGAFLPLIYLFNLRMLVRDI